MLANQTKRDAFTREPLIDAEARERYNSSVYLNKQNPMHRTFVENSFDKLSFSTDDRRWIGFNTQPVLERVAAARAMQ
jgi:hypothetical protein